MGQVSNSTLSRADKKLVCIMHIVINEAIQSRSSLNPHHCR